MEERTVKDILADQKESALFGEYLKFTPGNEGIQERLMQGKAEVADLEKMGEQKDAFLDRRKQVQEVGTRLTSESMSKLAEISPKIKLLMKVGSVDDVRDAVSSRLELMAMREPAKFQDLVDAHEKIKAKQEAFDIKIKEKLGSLGITEEAYAEVINKYAGNTSPEGNAARQNELREMIKEKIFSESGDEAGSTGRRPSYWKLKPRGQHKKDIQEWEEGKIKESEKKLRENTIRTNTEARKLGDVTELMRMREQYDKEMINLGELLGAAVTENEDISKAFVSEVTGAGRKEEEKLGGFQEMKEMKGVMPSEEDLKKDWEKDWAAAQKKGKTDKDAYKNTFASGKIGDRTGTWSQIVKDFLMKSLEKF